MSMQSLPSMEHTFDIELKGSNTSKMFRGTFTYRRPNLRTRSEISKTEARLNGDLVNLDPDMKFMHEILATLRHTITHSPAWWIESDYGYEMYDANVAIAIYTETRKFENEWTEKVWRSEEKAEEAPKE